MTMFNRRDIPHPYLYPGNQDYLAPAHFRTAINVTRDPDNNTYHIGIIHELEEPSLQELIDNGQACFTTIVDCTRARLRETYQSTERLAEIILDGTKYSGTVTINAFITATVDINNFKADRWNEWLKMVLENGTNVPQGAILAAAQSHTFDPDFANEMESCLQIIPSDRVEIGEFEVELEEDLINILVNTEDKPYIDKLRQNPDTQDQLWPGLYLPAIIQAIQNLGEPQNAEKTWAKTLSAKLGEHGIQLDEPDLLKDNALKHAQKLMQKPLSRLLKQP